MTYNEEAQHDKNSYNRKEGRRRKQVSSPSSLKLGDSILALTVTHCYQDLFLYFAVITTCSMLNVLLSVLHEKYLAR